MSYFSHYAELKIKIKAPHTHVEKDFYAPQSNGTKYS